MRNLKRVLSLALALVMVLGMMVITTSAAAYADAEEITYTEAVDVMTAIGVLEGDGTNFNPTDKLTREQGAKILCYLLMGKTNAEKLVGSGAFTDVLATRWSAGAIDYCASLGILAGVGNDEFNPTGELTAVAYGKMLLCALGYDAKIQGYEGKDWAANIAIDMIAAGLDVEGVALDQALTREAAAQMTLQALQAATVTYPNGKGTDISFSDGTSVSIGAGAVAKVAGTGADYADDANTYMELVEKLYPKLQMEAVDASANYGLAGYIWFLNRDGLGAYNYLTDSVVGLYTTEAVSATYAGGTKFADIVKALGVKNAGNKYYAVEVYRNGLEADGVYSVNTQNTFVPGTYTGAALYTAATNFGAIPNGVTVDIVVTATGTIRLLINIEYLGVVSYNGYTKDTNKDDVDDRNVTVAAYANGTATGTTFTLTARNCASFEEIYAAAAGLKNPNAKLYYVIMPEGDLDHATGYLLNIAPAASVTGKVSTSTGKVYTINGAATKLSATADALDMSGTGIYTVPAVYYLDTAGNILYKTATPGVAANYAFIEDIQVYAKGSTSLVDGAGYYMQAKLVMPDGTTKIVDLESVKLHGDSNTYSISGATGTVKIANDTVMGTVNTLADSRVYCAMTYTVNDDGTYNLVEANTAWAASGAIAAEPAFAGSLVAYDNTTFIVRTGNAVQGYKYAVYTGYANLPVDKTTSLTATVYGNVAGNVYYLVGASSAVAGQAQYAYITNATPEYTYVNGTNKDTYVFQAIVDGAATTVTTNSSTIATTLASVGMYEVKYTDGKITEVVNNTKVATDTVTTAAKDGVVYIENVAKAYNADTIVYIIENGAVTTGAMTDIPANAEIVVEYVKVGQTTTSTVATVYYAK